MGRYASRQIEPIGADEAGCADERIRFLTTGPAGETRVRAAILASWRRSRDSGVAADRVDVPYVRDPDVDTVLTRTAEPVLRRLADRLHGTPVSIILTDPAGLVLRRRTDDSHFERRLDSVLLAPGFSYAERFAGTNGIGTALESGKATQVLGHEHYAENLETFACAAGPIRDPRNGRIAGVVNLTCRRGDADGLLLTLAETTAEQIEHALAETAGRRELELMRAYRRACARTGGPVLALAADTVVLNDRARTDFDAADQAVLLARAAEHAGTLGPTARRCIVVALPSGRSARVFVHRVGDAEPAAVVAHVRVDETSTEARNEVRNEVRIALPGLVGTSARWQQAAGDVLARVRAGRWVAVHGEPGVGKLALLRGAFAQAGRRVRVVDAADRAAPVWRDVFAGGAAVVVTHVDRMPQQARSELLAAVQVTPPSWLGVTFEHSTPHVDELLMLFDKSIELAPLRLRREDIAQLASSLLEQVARRRALEWSPEATRLLVRAPWPGNVTQLRGVVAGLAQRRRSGRIEAADLPSELHTTSPRLLTPLESVERDAIVQALADASGSKAQAARLLGISRATVYRKIHEYGIVPPG